MPKKHRVDEDEEELLLPDGEQMLLGVIQDFLGFDRARVLCEDGKVRLCRIPGRMKKRVWMRVGDIVLVSPWDFKRDERGDIVFRYMGNQVSKLEEKGLLQRLKQVTSEFYGEATSSS